jgi:CDP-diacylglycerol---glycerol-3-phosphate 3-phosphatidyltransferase
MATRFEPTAIATPANAVTVARLLISPLLFVMIGEPSWGVLALWTGLCVTDGIDGFLARRHGVTRSGAFLDPLADKVLVLGAMFALVAVDRWWWLPVTVIAVREIAISLYRTRAAKQGVSVPANRAAKLKTVMQQFAVAFALCPPLADDAPWLWQGTLWIAVALTVGTGVHYLTTARETARRQLATPT